MLLLKACPRCRGDLYFDRDFYGQYKQCIQCGHMEDIADAPRSRRRDTARTNRDKVVEKAA